MPGMLSTPTSPPISASALPWVLSPQRVTRFLAVTIALITALSLAEQYVIHILGRADLEEFLIAFDVDAEANLPTWYASVTLFAASLLLGIVGEHTRRRGERYSGHWRALSVIVGVFSVDEIAQLHEHLGRLHEVWHTHGIFYFAWVIPGSIAVLAALSVFARFLWHLPPPIRTRLVLAGAIYFGGALGVEALSGWRAESMGMNNMTHSVIATIEEDMEMIGVGVLIVTLLRHMSTQGMSLLVSAGGATASPAGAGATGA